MKNAALLVIALLLFGCSFACGKEEPIPPTSAVSEYTATWQEQYDLGVRFLSEGNYQEAILAFTAAIEIDPKQPDAYYSRGDAYAALAAAADNEVEARRYYENAMADYRRAGELGHSDGTQRADSIHKSLDKTPLEKELQRIQQENEPLLRNLLYKFETDDPEGVAALLIQDEYIELCDSMMDTFIELSQNGRIDKKRYFQQVYDPEYDCYHLWAGYQYLNDLHILLEAENGNFVALYHNHCCYYGQWENEMRSGYGIWVGIDNPSDSFVFEGSWSNDRPNGAGTLICSRGYSGIVWKDEGTFKDGFYHGMFLSTMFDVEHDLILSFEPFNVIDGMLETRHLEVPSTNNDSAMLKMNNAYVLAYSEKDGFFEMEPEYHDDYYEWGVDPERDYSKYCVPGFMEVWYSNHVYEYKYNGVSYRKS